MVGFVCPVKAMNCLSCGICGVLERLSLEKGLNIIKLHDLNSLSTLVSKKFRFSFIFVRTFSVSLDTLFGISSIQEMQPEVYFFILTNEENGAMEELCKLNNVSVHDNPRLFLQLIEELRACDEHMPLVDNPAYIDISSGISLNLTEQSIIGPKGTINLSKKEFELLLLLLNYRGQFLTTEQILQEIWDIYTGPEIVRQYVLKLRKKLFVDNQKRDTLIYRRGLGYRIVLD